MPRPRIELTTAVDLKDALPTELYGHSSVVKLSTTITKGSVFCLKVME